MSIDGFVTCLKKNIDEMSSEYSTNIITGIVVNLDPLIVNIEVKNIPLTGNFLTLSAFCFDKYVKFEKEFTTSTSQGENPHNHTVLANFKVRLWRGLRKGDIVNMVHSSSKQKYFIIDYQGLEVGEVDDDTANINIK